MAADGGIGGERLNSAQRRSAGRSHVRRAGLGLAAAFGTVALAYLVREVLEPWLGEQAPLILFTLPVLFCSLYCGRAAATVAAALGCGVGLLGFRDDGQIVTAEWANLGTFALVCAGIILLADKMLRARLAEVSENARATRAIDEVTDLVEELERRERHLRSILETVPDAMIVIDEEGGIISFSAAAEKMFGYREQELLGENVSVLMPSPDREQHDSYLRRYLTTGEHRIIGIGRITNARRRDGSNFPIHLHVGETLVGQQRLFTGFIEDLTERQKTELKLHDLQDELTHVSRVTAMGTLATSLAHELNQPLTAIANYVETARELLEDCTPETVETVREALQECAAQSVRAGQIVRRLRDFVSRGESERRVESLSRLISEASALALVGSGDRGIEVDVKLGRDIDKVLVDRIQIQQVLLNLIRNAVEAMSESDTRRLEISSRQNEPGFIEVTVADSGPGLPQEVAERLFEPFVSTKSAGMGLGLSICHTIVTGHGGRIWSGPSHLGGTAFHFTLMDGKEDVDER